MRRLDCCGQGKYVIPGPPPDEEAEEQPQRKRKRRVVWEDGRYQQEEEAELPAVSPEVAAARQRALLRERQLDRNKDVRGLL